MKEFSSIVITNIKNPLSKFLKEGTLGGVLLLCSTVIALVWSNSPFYESYDNLLHLPISLSLGVFGLSNTIGHWINDGLMTIFFFVVGLEIKRELLVGELSNRKTAMLPAFAALGGMVVPALFYFLFNAGTPYESGWGIPMATDIAFALGVVSILGNKVPLSLKVFLLALAIFDDMGAIIVIAIFYTSEIIATNLVIAIIILAVSILLNVKGVRTTYPYALLGGAMWLALLGSGIHATISGVLLALTIPAKNKYDCTMFKKEVNQLIKNFPEREFDFMVVDKEQRKMMKRLQCTVDNLDTPLQKLEDSLHGLANYVIIPLFALANAGVSFINSNNLNFFHPISMGVVVGMVLGKPLGIALFTLVSEKLGLTQLPEGVTTLQVIGIGCLGGIGFTMSLFITNLAFQDEGLIDYAKLAILTGSLISSGLGIFILLKAKRGRR